MFSPAFFFQAEDGIRDIGVTGVQTCALPISTQIFAVPLASRLFRDTLRGFAPAFPRADRPASRRSFPPDRRGRSEERRVGKECRSPGSPQHSKKQNTAGTAGRTCYIS